MRHVLRAPGGRSEVTLHQGEEGGLKLTKRSLFTFRAESRLWGEISLFRFRSFQSSNVVCLPSGQWSKWLIRLPDALPGQDQDPSKETIVEALWNSPFPVKQRLHFASFLHNHSGLVSVALQILSRNDPVLNWRIPDVMQVLLSALQQSTTGHTKYSTDLPKAVKPHFYDVTASWGLAMGGASEHLLCIDKSK